MLTGERGLRSDSGVKSAHNNAVYPIITRCSLQPPYNVINLPSFACIARVQILRTCGYECIYDKWPLIRKDPIVSIMKYLFLLIRTKLLKFNLPQILNRLDYTWKNGPLRSFLTSASFHIPLDLRFLFQLPISQDKCTEKINQTLMYTMRDYIIHNL